MAASSLVSITPIDPAGPTIKFCLLGDAVYGPAGGGGNGGWQIVDRPRLVAATQWYDRSPMQLELPLMLDAHTLYLNSSISIEPLCYAVDLWQDRTPGKMQPPTLAISGPVPGQQHNWVLKSVTFNEALRNKVGGYRFQQKMTMTLYEYNSPLVSLAPAGSPAQAATAALNAEEASQSFTIYVVVKGDTLSKIASKVLGNYALWTRLATLNDIRDPNTLSPGQLIKIPQY